MFDQLFNLVKEHASEAIVKNQDVPNEHNEASMREATNTIHQTLSSEVQKGNFQDVVGMFGKGGNMAANPMVGQMIGQFAGKLAGQFGVDERKAQGIASTLIPQVLGQLTKKTNDPNDSSFDINSIMGNLSGGKTSNTDFGGLVKNMQQGGDVDFGSLSGMMGGGGLGGLF